MVIRSSVDNILIATNGTNGQPGTPGTSSYIHIKYSNDGGKTFTANSGEAIGAYIGIYRDSTEEDSSHVSDYQWKKIEGEDGEPAYTVMLSNENFSISTDTSYVPIHTQSFTCNVTVLKGSSPTSFTITASTDTENDIVTTVNGHAVNITVAPVEALSTTQGVITLTISTTEGHSFTKDITWSVAIQGKDGHGVSITDVTNYYLATLADSGVTKETAGWTTTIQNITDRDPYLWNYEVVTGSDGSTISSTEPVIIGRYGRDGEAAAEGRGIYSITEHYQVSSSKTTPPTTWSDTPIATDGTNKYLWNYETITYTDNTSEDTQKRVIGTQGETGTSGRGIVSITEYFLLSATDDASQITFPEVNDKHGWTTVGEALIWSKTKPYLWHCTEVVYENPRSIVYTDKYCDTSWKAADLVQSNLTDFQQGVDNVIDRDNQSIRSAVWENTYTYKPKTDSEGHYMYDDDGKIISDKDNTRTMSQYMAEQIVDMDGITSRVSSTEANVDGIGNRLSTAESTITQHATDIEAKVSKDGVIAAINLSTETEGGSTAKISADKVEINGTAIFNTISDDVNSAIEGKGYATTTQAQGYANTAEQNAIAEIPTDISELNNDVGYQTASDVSGAIDTATSDMATNTAVANTYAAKTSAVNRSQRIYYRKTTSGAPSKNTTWLTASGTGYGNWSLSIPPLTSGNTKYPYLYTAVQTQTVAQQTSGATSNNCYCSDVLIDDTATIIDGGTIITGTVTAREITTDNLQGDHGWINLKDGKFYYGDESTFSASDNAISWNGSKLQIKADEFLLSSGKSILDELEAIETWFYPTAPTTSNEPASNWTTDNLKEMHLRDIYFDTSSGKSYRWAKDGTTYKWVEIEDKELSALAGRLSTAETNIQSNSEQIALRATKTEVETTYATKDSVPTSVTDLSDADDYATKTYAEGKANDAETNAKADTTDKLKFYYTKTQTDSAITQKAGEIALSVTETKISEAQDDWEDYADNAVSTAKAEIKVTTDGIETEVSKKVGDDEVISKINQSAETVKIQASKVEIDGTAIFNDSDFKAAADAAYDAKGSASAVQENLDNLEIGGRNLLRHTKDFAESTYTSTCTFAKDTEDITVITFPAYTDTLSWKGCTFHPNIPYTLIRNKTVTLSFWYRSDSWTVASGAHNYPLPSFEILATSTANPSGNDRLKYTTIYDATVPAPTTEWQQFVRTYNITDSFFTAGSGTVTADKYFTIQFFQHNLSQLQYKKFKLEIGNKATDWSPAPEDTDAAIDTAIKSVAQNWFANCDTAATTADKVATITPATEIFTLKTGDTVNVKFKYTNSYSATASSPCTLNINGTGAKHIYYGGSATPTGTNTTAFGRAGYTNTYVYDGEYWVWVSSSADNNTTYNLGQNQHSSAIKATNAITKQHIICGTSVGYKMLAASTEFDLSYPLLYTTVDIADEKTSTSTFLTYPGITYTTTGTITAGAANAIIYLKGTVTGNTFKTTAAPFMTCTAPTSEDGYFYIPLGTMTSATAGYFNSSRNLYAYIDGKFRQVTPTEIVVSQRIYYRSYVAGTVSKPTAWITQTGNKYNDTVSVGNSGWSTKITPIAKSIAETTATNKKYLFLYTCEQRKRLDGTVDCTPILLDDSTTVIDGGNIITGTVTANQIAANAVTAEKIASHSISTNHLDIGDNTNLAQANENIPNSLPGQVWNGTSYDEDGISFNNNYKLNIQDGYLVKKTATQAYMMFTDFVPSSFRTGDELYYEFYAKAASATTVAINCWGYSEKYTSSVCSDYVTGISLTTSEQLISGTIQLTKEQWNTTAKYYLLGINNNASTKVQISVRKVIFRKKNGGELIVDGSITANKIQGNSLSIGVFDTATQNSVLNSNLKVGGRNLIVNTNIIDVSSDATLPRIISQSVDTRHSGTITAAEHGIRTTVGSASRPAIRFGSDSADKATMNGLKAGGTYTISFDCKWKMISALDSGTTSVMRVWIQDDRTTTGTLASSIVTTFGTATAGQEGSARCEGVFTIPDNVTMCNLYISAGNTSASSYAAGDYIELANIKLEEGNMASSWTAAPEDIDEDMKSSFNAINDTISNIKIGGRNLFINTNAPETTSAKRPKMIGQTQNSVVNTKSYVTEHGLGDISSGTKRPYIRFGNNTVGSESLNGLTAGGTYVFSADCEYLCTGVNAGSSIRLRIGYMTEGATSFTVETIATLAEVTAGVNDSVRCETVFTIPEEATGFYLSVDCTDTSHFADGDYIGLDNLKLEEGNKATAWSPAPEDINNGLVSVNDRVDATNDAINSFETTVTGWLTFENAKLTIGQKEKNNIFRTEITGTEMSFWEDTTKVAYISNKELNITDATVKENLTIGKFIFRPHESGDGGMSLIWS